MEKNNTYSTEDCEKIPHHIDRIRRKKEDLDKEKEELKKLHTAIVKKSRELEEQSKDIRDEIKLLNEIMLECCATSGNQCPGMPEDLIEEKVVEEAADQPKDRKVVIGDRSKMCRFTNSEQHNAQKYVTLNRKKKIVTTLHHILDAIEKKGSAKARDLASAFDMDKEEVLFWAKVMNDRGMLDLKYNVGGEPVLKKKKARRKTLS